MTNMFQGTQDDIEVLLNPQTIQKQAAKILALSESGQTHFIVHQNKIKEVAHFVAEVTKKNYPSLNLPFHSRWSHFQVGGVDRIAWVNEALKALSPEEQVRSQIDLVIVSVLLDAGAGMAWKWKEPRTSQTFSKSEGLAVASLELFFQGYLSENPKNPFELSPRKLEALSEKDFKAVFQVDELKNPLVGVPGRLLLLKNLAKVILSKPEFFGESKPRLGHLVDYLKTKSNAKNEISVVEILKAIQKSLGEIWPGRVKIQNFNLGDVWPYSPLGEGLNSLVPFHKLSQWLSYSLLDPLSRSGLKFFGFEQLTALSEYRNGGLLVDSGILELRNPADIQKKHQTSSSFIIEWRALTVALLPLVAEQVRVLFGKTEQEWPLGKVLEGGTWSAGRILAAQKRADGSSPILIESDGTVF